MIVISKHSEGAGWIELEGIGRINRGQDNVAGGRTYFTAMADQGGNALTCSKHVGCGPGTWFSSLTNLSCCLPLQETASTPSLRPLKVTSTESASALAAATGKRRSVVVRKTAVAVIHAD